MKDLVSENSRTNTVTSFLGNGEAFGQTGSVISTAAILQPKSYL